MAIALLHQGPIVSDTTATTVAPTFGAPTTAGNLLVAVTWQGSVSGGGIATGTGWVQASPGVSNAGAFVFYKKNCGASETPPTFNSNGSVYVAAQLTEWTGADITAPLDKAANDVAGATSPQAMNLGANDSAVNDLVIAVWNLVGSKTLVLTASDTWSPAGGTKVATATDAATKQQYHGYASYYVNTAGGAAHDINTLTFSVSTGLISSVGGSIASFKVAGPAQVVVNEPNVVGVVAVARASSW